MNTTEKTVGFFTQFSAENWFFNNGDKVKIIAKKEMTPQGDGSPHLIIKMEGTDELFDTIYPDGMIMEKDFEEFKGRILP